MGLTNKKKDFIKEYLIDLNATQAAIRAGYSQKTAYSQGQRLLKDVEIQHKIQHEMDKRAERTEITADRVLNEIAKLAFSDLRNIFDENGRLKPIDQLPEEISASISSIKVTSKQSPGEEPVEIDYVSEIKLWDKKGSLELLGKHLKLFTEKIEHEHKFKLEDMVSGEPESNTE